MKYPSMYYSFKYFEVKQSGIQLGEDPLALVSADDSLLQIQKKIAEANRYFLQKKFQKALEIYLQVRALLLKSMWDWFPKVAEPTLQAELVKTDLTKALIEKSSHYFLYGSTTKSSDIPVSISMSPPNNLIKLAKKYGAKIPDVPANKLNQGLRFLQLGQLDAAQKTLERALADSQRMRGNSRLKIAIKTSLAFVNGKKGDPGKAITQLKEIKRRYQSAMKFNPDIASSIDHNIGVMLMLSDREKEADLYFKIAERYLPLRIDRYDGVPKHRSDLPLVVHTRGSWNTITSKDDLPQSSETPIWRGGEPVRIDIDSNLTEQIETKLLESRIDVKTLNGLDVKLNYSSQFNVYLAHVNGFELPVAIGDCYFALGKYSNALAYYLQARDYKYINKSIERPMLWVKTAKVYLKLGEAAYEGSDLTSAKLNFEKLVYRRAGDYKFKGALYSGAFVDFKQEHAAFLEAGGSLDDSPVDYERRTILWEALSLVDQINAGLNLYGIPGYFVTIHSWQYLQNAARYFANQARQAERSYINFKDAAEQEKATHMSLEHTKAAMEAVCEVEYKREMMASHQFEAAKEALEVAELRYNNTLIRQNDQINLNTALMIYESTQAALTGGDNATSLSELAAARRQKSMHYENREIQRQIDELKQSIEVASKQAEAAKEAYQAAIKQKELAELRAEQAADYLAAFETQEFDAEMWNRLADFQKEISQKYLKMAIDVALRMEQAFENEYDLIANHIRSEYLGDDTKGLLAADDLIYDIDQFTLERLLHTDKQAPMKKVISLAESFPYAFLRQFLKTGRLDFETSLNDFDYESPGMHIRKLRRVEVIVQGLVGPGGLNGIIRNSGISRYRDREGTVRIRVQCPEALPLSFFDIRRDGFIFTAEESLLNIFENSGVASGWTIEFPPESNDVDLSTISDIHVVFYYDGYHSDTVENRVRAELAAAAFYEYRLTIPIASAFVDEFFELQSTGRVKFALTPGYTPYHHANAKIKNLFLVLITDEGIDASGVSIKLKANSVGTEINATTDGNGMIMTDDQNSPLNAFRGNPLEGGWIIEIEKAANQMAFDAGFSWTNINEIFFAAEYEYLPAYPPTSIDDFLRDTLSEFDVVDDPAVTNESDWRYLPGKIAQRARVDIIGNPSDPAGTYLVRKASEDWPIQHNFVMRAHLRSSDVDGIGLVFNFIDPSNFYVFYMDRRNKTRILAKKREGEFTEIVKKNVNPAFELNQTYEVSISKVGGNIAVALDGGLAISTKDSSLTNPGRVGFYCRGNSGAYFNDLSFRSL